MYAIDVVEIKRERQQEIKRIQGILSNIGIKFNGEIPDRASYVEQTKGRENVPSYWMLFRVLRTLNSLIGNEPERVERVA